MVRSLGKRCGVWVAAEEVRSATKSTEDLCKRKKKIRKKKNLKNSKKIIRN